ncbi:MAG TPA: phage minor capsid protein, partial [Tissierellaceae bacterium]|nr:phage minor capsid protein [Tissierellaceae bacterium]
MTPKYIQDMPDELTSLFLRLEEDIITDLSGKLKDSIEKQRKLALTEDADYLIERLSSMGYDIADIEKEIAKTTKRSTKEIEKLLKESSELSYINDRELYTKGGKILPAKMTPKINDFILATIKNSQGDLRNMTRTMGIVTNGGFKDLTKYYTDSLSYATLQLGSGAYSYQEAIENAIRGLAKSGVRTIDYKSG